MDVNVAVQGKKVKVWPVGVQVVTHGSELKAQGSAGQHGIDGIRVSCCPAVLCSLWGLVSWAEEAHGRPGLWASCMGRLITGKTKPFTVSLCCSPHKRGHPGVCGLGSRGDMGDGV